MTMTRSEYDHNLYMANREARIEAQQAYERDYRSKGLRKPRKKRDPNRRKARDHERYLRQRDERLERQQAYYQANRETILSHAKNRYLK